MAELVMKGTPVVMMWVLNVVAISEPTKSDRWLSVVFYSLFCSIGNSSILLWNLNMLVKTLKCHFCRALSSVYLSAQRRSCWEAESAPVQTGVGRQLLEASVPLGHVSSKRWSAQKRFLLTFASESSQSNVNNKHRFVRLLSFFFFVCDFMETQHSGSAGCMAPNCEVYM